MQKICKTRVGGNAFMLYSDKLIFKDFMFMKQILFTFSLAIISMNTLYADNAMVDAAKLPELKKMNAYRKP